MIQMMRLHINDIICAYYIIVSLLLQPIADKPFTFETELDDLPKEKLKGCHQFNLLGGHELLV